MVSLTIYSRMFPFIFLELFSSGYGIRAAYFDIAFPFLRMVVDSCCSQTTALPHIYLIPYSNRRGREEYFSTVASQVSLFFYLNRLGLFDFRIRELFTIYTMVLLYFLSACNRLSRISDLEV